MAGATIGPLSAPIVYMLSGYKGGLITAFLPGKIQFTLFDADGNVRGQFAWSVTGTGGLVMDAALEKQGKLFPNVPPTMTFSHPRLPFKDVLQLKFWPDFQPERWNFCADLNSIVSDVFSLLLSTKPSAPTLELSSSENMLIRLADLARIFPTTTSSTLPTFGVQKVAASDPPGIQKRGFKKGTGYSGSSNGRGANQVTDTSGWSKRERVIASLLAELWGSRAQIPEEALESCCITLLVRQTLASTSLQEFEAKSSYYSNLFEWGLFLYQKRGPRAENMSSLGAQIKRWNKELQDLAKLSGDAGPMEVRILSITAEIEKIDAAFSASNGAALPNAAASSVSSQKAAPSSSTSTTSSSSSPSSSSSSSCSSSSSAGESKKDGAGSTSQLYASIMKDMHVVMTPGFSKHLFKGKTDGTRNKKWMRRVAQEFMDMQQSLPLSEQGGVFLRWSESNAALMKIVIIPSSDTPYGAGCFEFDVCIPSE